MLTWIEIRSPHWSDFRTENVRFFVPKCSDIIFIFKSCQLVIFVGNKRFSLEYPQRPIWMRIIGNLNRTTSYCQDTDIIGSGVWVLTNCLER